MKPSACPPSAGPAVGCRVVAHAALRAGPAAIATLRRQPTPPELPPPPATLLKHADEQTVVALAAVYRAIADAGWAGQSFTDWGVIAAGNFFGRGGIAQAIQRYRREGAWGISPHMIPHSSVHATSGTISQALKLHGPNFGLGGGPDGSVDAFLAAATLVSDPRLPGLWLVLTGHDGEVIPHEGEGPAESSTCEAVALGLTPAAAVMPGLNLRICPRDPEPESHDFLAALPAYRLTSLADELTQTDRPIAAMWRLGAAGWVELDTVADDGETQQ